MFAQKWLTRKKMPIWIRFFFKNNYSFISYKLPGNNVSYSKVFCILEEKQEFHTNILYLPMSNTSRSGLDKLPFCWKWPWVFLILIFVMPNDVYLYSRLNLCILQWFHYSANYSACSVSKIIFIVFCPIYGCHLITSFKSQYIHISCPH